MLSDTVAKVLSEKGANVYSVTPDQPASDAMALMGQRRIAAVLVVSAGRSALSPPRTTAGASLC